MTNRLNDHPRLKAVLYALAYWGIFVAAFMAIAATFYGLWPPLSSFGVGMRHGVTGTVIALTVTWLFLKKEKRSFQDFGLVWERGTLTRFVVGAVIGGVIFILMLWALLAFGGLQLTWRDQPVGYRVLLAGLLPIVPLALMEELAFRAYAFRKLNGGAGLWAAQILTAIIFALYHVAGGWSWTLSFAGPFVWSFVFGLAAARSRGIAMATGIHVAMNMAQGLAGMKRSEASLWELSFPPGVPQALISGTDSLGLWLQLTVLMAALVVTAFTAPSRPSSDSPVQL